MTDAKVTFEKKNRENVGFRKFKCNFRIALECLCKKRNESRLSRLFCGITRLQFFMVLADENLTHLIM